MRYNTDTNELHIDETAAHTVVGHEETSNACPKWQADQLLAPVTRLEAELAAATDHATRERVANQLTRARATAAFGLARLNGQK